MGALIRAHDWSATPLGAPEDWPAPLKLTVRLILNTRHPMYIWWGPNLLCFYNDAYRASIGPELHPGSLGRPGREVWSEIWDIIGPQIDDVMAGRGATWHENALVPITRHGRRENVYWTYGYGPIDDETSANGIGGVLVVCTETTALVRAAEEKAAEAARLETLRANAAQFRTFAEAMLNHVWTADSTGRLDWFNRRVYAYSGATEGEMDADGWTSLVHPDDLPEALERWTSSLASGEVYETEFRLRRADGAWRWHLARAVALRGEDGATARWVGTNTDIEEQKAAAAALADINAHLESEVALRTGELMAAEEALRQSQKMEAVGQLTGGIAHDFNNLLAAISGSLELLEARIKAGRLDAVGRYLDAAQSAARRAAALTQRLLAFSRRQTLDPKPVNLNRLVGGLEDLLRRTVGPSVEVEVVESGGLWLTLADPNQLENALLNLCINARDAMPDGGRLTIESANKQLDERTARDRELPPGKYVSLSVTDTGTGMTPEVVARAFDPFFTTKPLGQGTGLGLSMIYGFVRQSGGQIRIQSEVGVGTKVSLYLPRFAGADSRPEDRPVRPEGETHGQGETVLVIDDEPMIRLLIVETLQDAGYTAIEAPDGPAGLAVLQSAARVDLLITDVGLPGGMNGRQIADAGRVLRPELKVLFITGYAENAVVGNGRLEAGMQVVTKPFAIEALGDKIRLMLTG